jgi:hypothetical protein
MNGSLRAIETGRLTNFDSGPSQRDAPGQCANQCPNAAIRDRRMNHPIPNPQSAMDSAHRPAAACVSFTTMSW